MPDDIATTQAPALDAAFARQLLAEHPVWAIRPESLAALHTLAASRAAVPVPAARTAPVEPEAAARSSRVPVTRAGVAIIGLRGVLTPRGVYSFLFGDLGGGVNAFRAALADALADDDVTSILIDVDSPGGVVSLIPETAADIRAARGTKPIVAIANTMAASAAYWLASQADELVVTPSGVVGSVGTLMTHQDWSAFNRDFGVDITYVTAGRYKAEGNPDEPLGEEARAEWQRWVDEVQGMFVADVAAGRRVTEATVRSESFGEGRIVRAAAAVAAGMADRVDTIDGTLARLSATGRPRRAVRAEADPETPTAAVEDQEPEAAAAEAPAVEAPEPVADAPAEQPSPAAAASDEDGEFAARMRAMRLLRA